MQTDLRAHFLIGTEAVNQDTGPVGARPLGAPDAKSGFEATYPFLIAKGARLPSLWIPSFGASARIASAIAEGARCP